MTFDTQESRKSEKRRPILSTEDILDTFQRFLARLKKELRGHTEDLKKDSDKELQHQALIDQDLKYIQTMEDSINRLLGDCR